MQNKYIVGIDPGLSGGISFLRDDGCLIVFDMPTVKKTVSGKQRRSIDRERLRQYFDRSDILHVMIERQGTRPGQAAGSTMVTGTNYGLIEGIILANYHPYTIIAPQTWKKNLNVPKDKKEAMQRATELMPRAAHRWANAGQDGRAESALLAYYGRQTVLNLPIPTIFTE